MSLEILPTQKEVNLAKWLQSLFKFETNISYYIYDYGTRYCAIHIEEANELPPRLHTNDDSLDWDRGKNSIIVAKFARDHFKNKGIKWYCSLKGFSVETKSLINFKNSFIQTNNTPHRKLVNSNFKF